MQKEEMVTKLRYYSKKFGEGNRSLGRDFKPHSYTQEAGMLTARPWHLVYPV